MAGEMYPDQSLYPVNSVPHVVRRINNTFVRADQIQHMEGTGSVDYFAPIVADAEAGFGGVLNAFELMKAMIEAGAAGVHFEDQFASGKKWGHMGGKVLVATREAVEPDLEFAKAFADAIHANYPGKMLAYNCSPSFNWKKNLDDDTVAKFQRELGAMGYKFQFITLAGFHSLNYSMFNLAYGYAHKQMTAFVELQEAEFAAVPNGFTAIKHQREVGTSYFDAVTQTVQGGQSSTTALKGSTEDEQFFDKPKAELSVANA